MDDATNLPLPSSIYLASPLVSTTHIATTDDGPTPGPLDLETINRTLSNPVLPQRPADAE